MNRGIKIYNKELANWIQQTREVLIRHEKEKMFSQGMKGYFNT